MQENDEGVKRVLWVEDDYFRVESLLYQISDNPKYELFVKESLHEATKLLDDKARNDHYFDLAIIDLIVSRLDLNENLPHWWEDRKDYQLGANGVYLIDYMRNNLAMTCPIIALTIIDNAKNKLDLERYEPISFLRKVGIRPSAVTSTVEEILGL